MKPQTRILSGNLCIVNQILPHRHLWAWECYLTGMKNHWNPASIPMSKDIEQWRSRTALTDDERLVVRRCLGFFAGSESLVANNLLLSVFRYCSDAECRQYILKQAQEEALHNHTVVHVCSSLGLDISEVYEAYRNIPSIRAKDDFLMGITTDLNRPDFAARMNSGVPGIGRAARQEFLRNLVTYYIICEGMLFYAGFAMLLSFKRFNKLPGICEQIAYTLRDEVVHVKFGTKLINTIVKEEPELWTKEFQEETVRHIFRAIDLEVTYVNEVLPRGVLGLSADLFLQYMRFIANERAAGLGLAPLFKGAQHPFPWMAEVIELRKQKNFFETHPNEYEQNSMVDDL